MAQGQSPEAQYQQIRMLQQKEDTWTFYTHVKMSGICVKFFQGVHQGVPQLSCSQEWDGQMDSLQS